MSGIEDKVIMVDRVGNGYSLIEYFRDKTEYKSLFCCKSVLSKLLKSFPVTTHAEQISPIEV